MGDKPKYRQPKLGLSYFHIHSATTTTFLDLTWHLLSIASFFDLKKKNFLLFIFTKLNVNVLSVFKCVFCLFVLTFYFVLGYRQ